MSSKFLIVTANKDKADKLYKSLSNNATSVIVLRSASKYSTGPYNIITGELYNSPFDEWGLALDSMGITTEDILILGSIESTNSIAVYADVRRDIPKDDFKDSSLFTLSVTCVKKFISIWFDSLN